MSKWFLSPLEQRDLLVLEPGAYEDKYDLNIATSVNKAIIMDSKIRLMGQLSMNEKIANPEQYQVDQKDRVFEGYARGLARGNIGEDDPRANVSRNDLYARIPTGLRLAINDKTRGVPFELGTWRRRPAQKG